MHELLQKVRAKALLAAGRNVIVGGVEHPPTSLSYVAWVDVRGWALGLDGQSQVTVHVAIDGRDVQRVTPALPRADVAQAFPDVRGSEQCGFEVRLGTDVLPWQGGCTLEVRAESSAPHAGSAVIATCRLERQNTAVSRANYGAVWDDTSVSGSVTNAMIAVAGTADPSEYDRSGADTADDVARLAAVQPTDTVVEIGCGTGRVGTKLASRCGHWVGCDVSKNMLGHARETLAALSNVSLVHLNGVDLSGLDSGSADVVYCTGVFMHLDEWDRYRYVLEARRVLRPGGRVYFDNFNLASDEGWKVFEDLFNLEPAARPPNVSRSSTADELKTYAARAGFESIEVLARGLWVTVVARKPA